MSFTPALAFEGLPIQNINELPKSNVDERTHFIDHMENES